MYILKRPEAYAATAASSADIVRAAREAIADATLGLTFDPDKHEYRYGGRIVRNVSSIVEAFTNFDAPSKAAACAANPKHEHFGKSPEEIIALWEKKRDEAAAAGTAVHAFGEACMLWVSGQEDEIEEPFRNRITPEGLVAESPKEEAAARWWAETDWSRYTVVAKETRVFNPVENYAGTFDLLLYDTLTRRFPIKDYKTNEDLYRWFREMLKAPLSMLKDNDIGKYTVQQTLYAIALKGAGIAVSDASLIWLKEDGYEEVPIPGGYEKVVAYAARLSRNQ